MRVGTHSIHDREGGGGADGALYCTPPQKKIHEPGILHPPKIPVRINMSYLEEDKTYLFNQTDSSDA